MLREWKSRSKSLSYWGSYRIVSGVSSFYLIFLWVLRVCLSFSECLEGLEEVAFCSLGLSCRDFPPDFATQPS